jgi:serine/threonine-protein kinase
MIGKTLGHYRIVEKLGAGGMGEVYRAEDARLSRQVAIKVLPEVFSHDSERLARFEREAKLLASLNHPNIAAIYGLEEADGKRFLVMELVEGETLAEWLSRGPLPMEMALGVCRQIAEGTEAAHEKGIIHRDLKPGNVKITPEGKVKILDFGLAKAYQKEASVPDLSKSPTLTDEMTRPGVILGTAAYMSPEQAKGKPVDKRADIWAFGCVLYECLTGEGAFQGETLTEIVAGILKSEPDWSRLPKDTPALVHSLLRRCLQKDPSLRLRDIGDARIEIGESIGQSAEVVSGYRRYSFGWLTAGAAIILLAGLLIGLAVRKPTQPPPFFVVRAMIKLGSGQWVDGMRRELELQRPSRTGVALSNEGRFIVYSAVKENPGPEDKPRLYLRRTDQAEAKPIAGTEGGINPFLSPDDRWVGFWAGGKLMKVSIDGGVPVPLCVVVWPFGANWASDNSIVFSPDENMGLFRVSAEGGEPESVTTPDKTREEYSHRLPHCLPDGKGVLFTIMRESFDLQPRVAWLDLKTRKWRVLMGDAADARYVPTGHLVFLRQGTLMVVPFDLGRHEVTGQPVPAIANVMQALNVGNVYYNTAAGQFSISDSGWLVYAEGGILPDQQNSLVWVDQKGRAEPIASVKAPFFAPRLSPDGQRIADIPLGREQRVWVYDLNRGTTSLLTDEGKSNFPTWTLDSKRVVFGWSKTGPFNLHWRPADGSSATERLTTSDYHQNAGSWSPDGNTLAFVEIHPSTGRDILLLDLPSRRITSFLNSSADEYYPEFSSDGRWLAYMSDESGRQEVYVRPFPGPGGKWLISQEEGLQPLWARNGKQLFYRSPDWGQVWVVDVHTDVEFSASKPRLLFKLPGLGGGVPIRTWDLSLDGQRFLMVKMGEAKPTPVTELVLVQNWFEELKHLAPTKR